MNTSKRLLHSYTGYIRTPWRPDVAAPQRVIFCIYPETEELRLRAHLGEFELATRNAAHDWSAFDITDAFPTWMAAQEYAQEYFQSPALLTPLLPRFRDYLVAKFEQFMQTQHSHENAVVAVYGVGSLFGFLKVKEVVDRFAPLVHGRLLIFFPGSHENNNYRLLNGYDGWNYLAVPITPDKEF